MEKTEAKNESVERNELGIEIMKVNVKFREVVRLPLGTIAVSGSILAAYMHWVDPFPAILFGAAVFLLNIIEGEI